LPDPLPADRVCGITNAGRLLLCQLREGRVDLGAHGVVGRLAVQRRGSASSKKGFAFYRVEPFLERKSARPIGTPSALQIGLPLS
jgi:hypothetical protein